MKSTDLIRALKIFDKYLCDDDDLQVNVGNGGGVDIDNAWIEISMWVGSWDRYMRTSEISDEEFHELAELGFEPKGDIYWCKTR